MILTVTPNPAIDKIYWIDRLDLQGEAPLTRATRSYLSAGGKGINVSIFLAKMGIENVAMGFVAGETGRALERRVREENITTSFIWAEGETRTNVTLLEKGSEQRPVQISEIGPTVTPQALQRFFAQYKRVLPRARYVFLGGTLPPGVPAHFYQELSRLAHKHGAKVIINAAGEPLSLALATQPWLVKPDTRQLRQIDGYALTDASQIARTGGYFVRERGVGALLVSHKITHDVLVTSEDIWDLEAHDVCFKNLLGAEDALLAGMISALIRGASLLEAARFGMAAATASAESEGLIVTDRAQIESVMSRITVERL
ncbi:hexose kinase [Candidatus Acetothermia bacterium]|nr:hexose kinase [Candidatus Acetothermia bacterium]MCI2431865.1 hexose kinase [Candidatus Acetothermia bacterium]MCI2435968.1 hexose kinase [Candidatus Acetothermia bacterium]